MKSNLDLTILNNRQREAVVAPPGPLLVLAGAGSGKTRVLAYRIVYIIEQGIIAPDRILALTFTNKAAGEMKERVADIKYDPVRWLGSKIRKREGL